MRRTLAWVALAVTSMVALSFLIPLALLVRSEARTQAITAAEQRAAALAPALALTSDTAELRQTVSGLDPSGRLSVHLPDGRVIGATHAPAALLLRAQREGASLAENRPGGWVYLQPVVLGPKRVAVVEEFVPKAELDRGIAVSLWVMAGLALGLVVGSVLVADRLAARVVRSSVGLSRASHALGAGDLETRVTPMGPPELYEAGLAFNAMAERMLELLAIERELVADLSHRLRTPLTALHLAAERMGPTPDAARVAAAVQQLETELQAIITAARTPLAVGPMGQALRAPTAPRRGFPGSRPAPRTPGCSAAEVVGARAGFWSILAEQQDRACRVYVTAEDAPLALSAEDLTAVVDALVGNVFRHTPAGTPFAVRLERGAQTVTLVVDDAGPGIPDPAAAMARGASAASTGLGLDIAHRAAATTRGTVDITTSPLGGVRIAVTFGLAPAAATGTRRRKRAARGKA
ncbi:HAMP domain-containing sensor histidine kinase [Streptomyces sp. NPDC051976]|uniref:HAMP domain-containing sensor histidine kinase n=1 Tax=Streptomyces sp. NPDC051976 TaxID=3154947 RepID=UPI0034365AC8